MKWSKSLPYFGVSGGFLHDITGFFFVAIALIFTLPAEAESARTRQLSEMLENDDFRVRTQAAFSLGRLDDPGAVHALVEGLNDDHPAVRAAAAVALGRLGDAQALPHLRRHEDQSGAVRTQVNRAIELIEANSSGMGQQSWTHVHHYVELDAVSNVSKTKRPGLSDMVRSLSLRELRRLSGVYSAEAEGRPPEANDQIKRRKLSAYSISVSLGRLVRYMGPGKVQIRAEVMIAVTTYPDRVYRMTANGNGSVTIPRQSFRLKQVPALQEDALSGALQQAFRTLGKTLNENAKTAKRPAKARSRKRR